MRISPDGITKSDCVPATPSRIRFLPAGTADMPAVLAAGSVRRIRFVDGLPKPMSQDWHGLPLVRPLAKRSYADSVPEISYELRSGSRVMTTICGRACRALAEHCGESNLHGHEVGGILVGTLHQRQNEDEHWNFILSITDLIPIRSFDSSSAHINFTEEDWIAAECELRRRYAPEGKCLTGWYHTHPLQGIFFSLQDRRAHEIFPRPYQCALVVDPRTMEAGLFYWSSYEERVVGGPICFALRRGGK
jgi:proteasome lid subunit RPN8/RPN11